MTLWVFSYGTLQQQPQLTGSAEVTVGEVHVARGVAEVAGRTLLRGAGTHSAVVTRGAKVTGRAVGGVGSEGGSGAVVPSAALPADVGQSSHRTVVAWGQGQRELDNSATFSTLELCEGGSFSPTIFNSDID